MSEIIEFEGAKVEICEESVYQTDLQPGDLYLAWSSNQRRFFLLTCREVSYGANRCDPPCNEKFFCQHHPDKGHASCIHPQESAYSYDSWVSYKVISVDGEKV